jgi:hypothetical protein
MATTHKLVSAPCAFRRLTLNFSIFLLSGAPFGRAHFGRSFAQGRRGCPTAVAYLAYLARKSYQLTSFEWRIANGRKLHEN